MDIHFENTVFQVIDRNGEPWLAINEIAPALGCSQAVATRLFDGHSGEFTPGMADMASVPTNNGMVSMLIFSLRGAHLLAVYSKAAHAAEFRRWVGELLDQDARVVPKPIPVTMPGRGRYLVDAQLEGVKVANAAGHAMVDIADVKAVQRDLATLTGAMANMRSRLKVMAGEMDRSAILLPLEVSPGANRAGLE